MKDKKLSNCFETAKIIFHIITGHSLSYAQNYIMSFALKTYQELFSFKDEIEKNKIGGYDFPESEELKNRLELKQKNKINLLKSEIEKKSKKNEKDIFFFGFVQSCSENHYYTFQLYNSEIYLFQAYANTYTLEETLNNMKKFKLKEFYQKLYDLVSGSHEKRVKSLETLFCYDEMKCDTFIKKELNSPIGLDFFDIKEVKKVCLMKDSTCSIFK